MPVIRALPASRCIERGERMDYGRRSEDSNEKAAVKERTTVAEVVPDKLPQPPQSPKIATITQPRQGFHLTPGIKSIILVVVILVVAAIALTRSRTYFYQAKKSVARSNLGSLRVMIHFYTVLHKGIPPGYPQDNPRRTPTSQHFANQLCSAGQITELPENPFNGLNTVLIQGGHGSTATATGEFGWIYMPTTATIMLDWPGIDSSGTAYRDY